MSKSTVTKEYQREALETGLPKWPQMLVWGTPVSRAQALEIIRRTDSFFKGYGGNDREWEAEAYRIVGRPAELDYRATHTRQDFNARMIAISDFEERWGVIDTQYVSNTWLASAYIGGPGGWCHPDGTIQFARNVGKWPDGYELFGEWATIAEAFPFLDLTAVFMSGESCDDNTEPLIVMHVQNGQVRAEKPEGNPFARFGKTLDDFKGRDAFDPETFARSLNLHPRYREHGIDMHQVHAWAKQIGETE